MTVLALIGLALHLFVFIVLLWYAWEDREDELHEETMRLRARRAIDEDSATVSHPPQEP